METSAPIFNPAVGRWVRRVTAALAMAGGIAVANAQTTNGLDRVGFAAGTVTRDAKGRDWAYVTWGASEPALLVGRAFAVYVKPGAATAAAPYVRKSIITRQTDGRAIDGLLSRSQFLGYPPTALTEQLDALFRGSLPAGLNSPGEKLAAVLVSASPRSEELLGLIGLTHPGVQLARGLAAAEMIGPGMTTLEIREFDCLSNQDTAILWRVTLTAGAPATLAAPGPPFVVRDRHADGTLTSRSNLVLPLRWGAPDALRRDSILQRGYNVYRLKRSFAEARGYQTTPPTAAILRSLLVSNPAEARQVNRSPVLLQREISPAEAADANDTTTIQFTDSNGADQPMPDGSTSPPRFAHGEAFYYFVTARDLLGREGIVSPAGLAEVCEVVPPLAPIEVKVANDFHYVPGAANACADQHLQVSWKLAPDPSPRVLTSCLVYRWRSVADMQIHAEDPAPAYAPVATLAVQPGISTYTWTDNQAGSPAHPADAGKVFFYSVRTKAVLPCGTLLSPPGGPASGTINDCAGASVPTNPQLFSPCYQAALSSAGVTTEDIPADYGQFHFRLLVTRASFNVEWVEYEYRTPDNLALLHERTYFADSPPAATMEVTRAVSRPFGAVIGSLIVKTGTCDGREKELPVALPPLAIGKGAVVNLNTGDTLVPQPPGAPPLPCPLHLGSRPGDDAITPLTVCMNVTADTREWRMYRRTDDGPLVLIKQGLRNPADPCARVDDRALPAGVANVAYYGQLLNDQGNPGAMSLLGRREVVVKPPAPLLAPVIPVGDPAHPEMTLRWFCQAAGYERFEVWLTGSTVPPPGGASNLAVAALNYVHIIPAANGSYTYYSNKGFSKAVGAPGFGSGPLFSVPLTVSSGVDYEVFVRGITRGGVCGPKSNVQKFKWTEPSQAPTVPWPARPLPPVNEGFNAGIAAVRFLSDAFGERTTFRGKYPIGVRIGLVGFDESYEDQGLFMKREPREKVFKDSRGASLLPVMAYRYEVPSAVHPQVSGDLIQVSPLITTIAADRHNESEYMLRDPFVTLAYEGPFVSDQSRPFGIYILDTQPVTKRARYRYLLVRFTPNGEVDQIIPTNEVTATVP